MNAWAKWESEFEGQNTGAIFMRAFKIFYMQLIEMKDSASLEIRSHNFVKV